jgi:hypothetical protein
VNPLLPKKLPTKNIIDVFSGQNHSFLICAVGKEKILKGWGLNVHGQLGMGKTGNIWKPEEIRFFADNNINVKYATGGDFHSLFLTENNELYVCGRNEVNQLGITEDEFHEILNKQKEERKKNKENSKTENDTEIKQDQGESQDQDQQEIRDDVTKSGMIVENENLNENEKKQNNDTENIAKQSEEIEKVVNNLQLEEENEDLTREDEELILTPIKLGYFDSASRPIHSIYSSMNFNYALDNLTNQAYSWGFGESYVLGNKKDMNQETPFAIPKGFFFNLNVEQIGIGSQHVVVGLFDASGDNKRPVLEYDVEHYKELLRAKKPIKAEKRKAEETLQEIREEEAEAKEKNLPRRSMRPKSEKKIEEAAPSRGRSKSKTAKKKHAEKKSEKKSKSKSKPKISKNDKKEENLDDEEMNVEGEVKLEKEKSEIKSKSSKSKSKSVSKSATKKSEAKSQKKDKTEKKEKSEKPSNERSKSKSKRKEPTASTSKSAKKK